MLEPPTCAKNALRLGCPCDAAASAVVATAEDPDTPTRWFDHGWSSIHSSVSKPSLASSP
jgi:hypothetical protein